MSNVIQFNREVGIPSDLMTVKEFAVLEGCSVSYIYKLRDKGKLRLYPKGYYKVSVSEAKKAMECKYGGN